MAWCLPPPCPPPFVGAEIPTACKTGSGRALDMDSIQGDLEMNNLCSALRLLKLAKFVLR